MAIQNEILRDMAMHILRPIIKSIKKSSYYSTMADETTDIINKEQFVICIRWVDNDLNANEDFTQPTFQRRINVVSTLWINIEITLIRR